MKLQEERVTARIPEEMKKQIEEVAKRYDFTMSKAICFLLDCGLDVEKSYRPVLIVTSKVMRFSEKIKESGNGEEVAE
ncbi:MAG: hypothetical protein IJ141_11010 [Lachnospiraceae bacterium]|nr:hypothetical protein [Lachnospiraceae bacterium]